MFSVPRRRFGALLLAAGFLLRAAGQDVTVTGPQWLYSTPAPDKLPHSFFRLRPDFPREERRADQIGYVLVGFQVAVGGDMFRLFLHGSQIPYERSVEAELVGWDLNPAETGGRKVDGAVWYGIIFNPASAATDGPDATPRLLVVTPVYVSRKLVAGLGERPVLPVTLDVDVTGTVTGVHLPPAAEELYERAVGRSTSQWRFSPARQAGRPIASSVTLPVVLQVRPSPRLSEGRATPPQPIRQSMPGYPPEMRWSRMSGEVTIGFVVTADGTVQNPVIVRSNNPGFNAAAFNAISRWRFKPALLNGQPVPARMSERLVFTFVDRDEPGYDAYNVSGGDQSKLPPEYRFDTPPRIRGALLPVYPYELLRDNVGGSATVAFIVDAAGRVAFTKVTQASRPEFGLALEAAVAGFEYDPAMRGGLPTKALLVFSQEFSYSMVSRDGIPGATGADQYLTWVLKKHPDRLVDARRLDHPLRPTSRRAPVFPPDLLGTVPSGAATVEIIIDQDGAVRVPRVISATDPAFGYAAVQAVESWRFEPPTLGGKAVMTRVQVPFLFHPRPNPR